MPVGALIMANRACRGAVDLRIVRYVIATADEE